MQQTDKRRCFWRDADVAVMLDIIKDKYITQLLNNNLHRNMQIYEEIANDLEEHGIYKQPAQIRTKYKILKSDYFKAKRSNKQNVSQRQTIDYYNLLQQVFEPDEMEDAAISTTITIVKQENVKQLIDPELASLLETPELKELLVDVEEAVTEENNETTNEFFVKQEDTKTSALSFNNNSCQHFQSKLYKVLRNQNKFLAKILQQNHSEINNILKVHRQETAKLFAAVLNATTQVQQSNANRIVPLNSKFRNKGTQTTTKYKRARRRTTSYSSEETSMSTESNHLAM